MAADADGAGRTHPAGWRSAAGHAAKAILDTVDGILKVRGRWREAKRQAWRDLLQLNAALDDTTEGVTEMLHHTTFYVRVPKLHNCPNSQTVAGQRWQT